MVLISKRLIIYLFLSLFYTFIYAQKEANLSVITIPSVAKLAIKSAENAQVIKNIAANSVVHQLKFSPKILSNNLWVNYSVTVGNSKQITGKKILVKLEEALPSEITLKLKIDKDLGKGGGNVGKAVAFPIILSTSPQAIITDIGTSFTGASFNHGHQIKYIIDENVNSSFQEESINIIYTLQE